MKKKRKYYHKKCLHNRYIYYCVDCGGKGVCRHGKRRVYCADCKGSQMCKHKRRRSKCKECHGSEICRHNNIRVRCVKCGGQQICKHKRRFDYCKKCGTHRGLLSRGFTKAEIKEMGETPTCQFPGCLIQGRESKSLNSDHFHGTSGLEEISRENYRGELCDGHNRILKDIDEYPEWGNSEAREYKKRRPYAKKGHYAHISASS